MSSTSRWRSGARRRPETDSLRTRDGADLAVWSADAADPVAYLASVIDELRDSRKIPPAGQPRGWVSR